MESSGEAVRIHIPEATRNLLDRLGVYYCEERGLTQFKVQLLPGVFYIAIYGIRWTVCSINSQHFVKSHVFTTGKTAVLCDTLESLSHTHTHTHARTRTPTPAHAHAHTPTPAHTYICTYYNKKQRAYIPCIVYVGFQNPYKV